MAENGRTIPGEAIIFAPYREHNLSATLATSSYQLDRIRNASFSSLLQEHLSDIAVRVSDRRKVRSSAHPSSVRYLSSRSPCKAPAIQRLLRISKSLRCEPNFEVELTLTPNDQSYSNIYAADNVSAGRIHLPEAWDLSTGSSSVVVGVIDSGIDYNHLDLAANIWTNPGEIAANGVDDDGNGYIDDIHGIDPYNGDSNPMDDLFHGTHVAGTIGAVGNNGIGVVGVSWNVKEIACKAFNSSGTGTTAATVACLNYLVKLKNVYGVNIVATSNSYGGFPYSIAMYNAIKASRDAGMVFVAGSGNNTSDNDAAPFYPASYDLQNVISVGAIDSSANIASFSNYGATSVDIFAPGVSVYSTIPGNQYAFGSGTSMATPHVSGAVALLLSYHSNYTYYQAVQAILQSGTSVPALVGKSVTGSVLNVSAAMELPPPSLLYPIETPTVPPGGSGPDLSTAKLQISASKSRGQSSVNCALSAISGSDYEGLPGYRVTLAIKGVARSRKATTNGVGKAHFAVRIPKGRAYSARCVTKVPDPETNVTRTIKSQTAKLRPK